MNFKLHSILPICLLKTRYVFSHVHLGRNFCLLPQQFEWGMRTRESCFKCRVMCFCRILWKMVVCIPQNITCVWRYFATQGRSYWASVVWLIYITKIIDGNMHKIVVIQSAHTLLGVPLMCVWAEILTADHTIHRTAECLAALKILMNLKISYWSNKAESC